MPKQDVTIWRPDTCDCEIMLDSAGNFVDYDDAKNEQQARIAAGDPTANKRLVRVLRDICPIHQNLGHMVKNSALLDVIKEESRRKSRGLSIALTNVPGLTTDDIDWSLDADRVLILNLPAGKCDVATANVLIGLYTAAFGPGKVIVNRV